MAFQQQKKATVHSLQTNDLDFNEILFSEDEDHVPVALPSVQTTASSGRPRNGMFFGYVSNPKLGFDPCLVILIFLCMKTFISRF